METKCTSVWQGQLCRHYYLPDHEIYLIYISFAWQRLKRHRIFPLLSSNALPIWPGLHCSAVWAGSRSLSAGLPPRPTSLVVLHPSVYSQSAWRISLHTWFKTWETCFWNISILSDIVCHAFYLPGVFWYVPLGHTEEQLLHEDLSSAKGKTFYTWVFCTRTAEENLLEKETALNSTYAHTLGPWHGGKTLWKPPWTIRSRSNQ